MVSEKRLNVMKKEGENEDEQEGEEERKGEQEARFMGW